MSRAWTLVASVACVALITSYAVAGSSSTTGKASYYRHGQVTASGERFNPNGLTAAHRTLKFGTRVRVTHVRTGRSVDVRINDRGPFTKGRIIDLSLGAARAIGLDKSGVGIVRVVILVPNKSNARTRSLSAVPVSWYQHN